MAFLTLIRLILLLFLLLCSQAPSASAGYLLKAFFHTYENPLHAYVDLLQIKLKCCKGPPLEPPCNHSCDTTLDYCFREFNRGSVNIHTPLLDCLSPPETSGLLEDTDYIDYSTPPLTAGGIPTLTTMTQRGDTWNGRVQFIVRSIANSNLVNVLMKTINLSPGETLNNISLPGVLSQTVRSDVIFTVSFSLNCEEDYYGPNCTIYCRPSDSDELGHYSCLSNGNIQCLQGFQNEDTNCTECAVSGECASEDGVTVAVVAAGLAAGVLFIIVVILMIATIIIWRRKCRTLRQVETRNSIDLKPNPVYGVHTAAEPVKMQPNPVYGVHTAAEPVKMQPNPVYGVHTASEPVKMQPNPVYGVHTAAEPVKMQPNPVYGVQTHQQSEDDTYYVNDGDGPNDPQPQYDYVSTNY